MDFNGFRVSHWGGGGLLSSGPVLCGFPGGCFLLPVSVLSAILLSRFMACGMLTGVVMGLTVFC